MQKYVTYTRVSTKDQSLGLDAQMTIINNFIQSDDVIVASYTEKESGRNSNRVELNKAIDFARKNHCMLIIARLDRLSRNVSFTSRLMDTGVKFVACDIPDCNNFTIHLFAALAQLEVDKVTERTKNTLAVIKANIKKDGYHLSKAGNKITKLGNGSHISDANRILGLQAMQVKKNSNPNNIKAKLLATSLRTGGMTLKDIAKQLNNGGFKSSRGGIFYPSSVSNLFK